MMGNRGAIDRAQKGLSALFNNRWINCAAAPFRPSPQPWCLPLAIIWSGQASLSDLKIPAVGFGRDFFDVKIFSKKCINTIA